jgi:hypothetical protein
MFMSKLVRVPWSHPSKWSRKTLEKFASRRIEQILCGHAFDGTPEEEERLAKLDVSRASLKELIGLAIDGRDSQEAANEEECCNRAEMAAETAQRKHCKKAKKVSIRRLYVVCTRIFKMGRFPYSFSLENVDRCRWNASTG